MKMIKYKGHMNFVDGLSTYFNNILDVTMYIIFFFYSLTLVILTLPKRIERRDILIALAKLVCLYVIYIFGESLFFGLFSMLGPRLGGILFTSSFIVFPVIYILIFSREYPLHITVKLFVMVASLLITSEIGRSIGFFVQNATGSNSNALVVIFRALPSALMPFVAFIIYRFNIHRFKHLPISHVIILMTTSVLLTVSAIWQTSIVDNTTANTIRWLLIFVSFMELLVLVGVYHAIYHVVDSRHRITELEVQSTVLSLERESLLIDQRNREELMKIRHDLKNQLSYTSVLLQEGKYEEADKYIKELVEQKEEYLYSFSCSNLVISGIVNLELTKAKIADKKIKFKVVVPPKLPFENSDLLSLITNIVDNSIENFLPVNEQDEINVSIVTQRDYLRITSFNSVDQKMIKGKPSLKTTKRNRGHGYGTKIIKNIVRKYEGHATFTFEEGKFVCDCLINMNHKGNINA